MNYDAGEREIGRIEGKVDRVLDELKCVHNKIDKFTVRIHHVERKQAWYSGAWAGVVLVVHWIVNKMKLLS